MKNYHRPLASCARVIPHTSGCQKRKLFMNLFNLVNNVKFVSIVAPFVPPLVSCDHSSTCCQRMTINARNRRKYGLKWTSVPYQSLALASNPPQLLGGNAVILLKHFRLLILRTSLVLPLPSFLGPSFISPLLRMKSCEEPKVLKDPSLTRSRRFLH